MYSGTGKRAPSKGQGAGRNRSFAGAVKKARCLLRDKQRGQLTPVNERQQLLTWFDEATANGASRWKAAEQLGISLKTLNRWRDDNGVVLVDKRLDALRPEPSNKLTAEEELRILDICNQKENASLPPSQIVPALADKGVYVASESSFYRVLKKHGQLHHRGRTKKRSKSKKPTTHIATGPYQVWCWDISYSVLGIRSWQEASHRITSLSGICYAPFRKNNIAAVSR
ncbi:helix-turn-helix domain-containing protein [Endozoicomonas acroporae]|uniref:helix-turn-helix domain-containing protein n=1 Tax=Endozoicomonas acroporae TaxID=1701104 RepID=UPI0013D84E0D|nr:helix-turn-helix domain-containing protein [Endozoicomonas acroporae]